MPIHHILQIQQMFLWTDAWLHHMHLLFLLLWPTSTWNKCKGGHSAPSKEQPRAIGSDIWMSPGSKSKITPRTKLPNTNLTLLFMQYSEVRSAQTLVSGRPKKLSTDAWLNTRQPPHRDRTQLYISNLRSKVTPLRTPMSTFWTEKTDGLKEAIYIHLEKPNLIRWWTKTPLVCKPTMLSWECSALDAR